MCAFFIWYNVSMQFNNHAQNQDICSDIDFWASTDSVTYPIEDKTRNANYGLSRVTSKIMQFDRTWKHVSSNSTTIPLATTDLVAGLDNYSFASTHLKILRVRIMGPDGKMKTIIATDRKKVSDDILNATGTPEIYDKIGYSLMPLPVPNYSAAGGVEIEYQPGADYFETTDTTKEPGFNPDFHRLVSLYAARDYCALHNASRLAIIDTEIQRMEADLKQFFESRDIDDEPAFQVKRSGRGVATLL